ncbi:MAG TPA: MFS transporter [Candidatus Eubacterium faecavium]|nr:MFS transporter [Candidatus Eubacterium faecavium]
MESRKLRTYTPKERNMYLAGMFGQNMIYNIIATGLVSYYLQYVIYIPVAAIGVIVTVARVWDAINDPMMGTIVDITKSKWGKCRPYLIFAPPIIGLITILCFVNGNYVEAQSSFQQGLIIAWAAVSYILWGMSFTVGDIPLWGITSLMTEDQNQRSQLLGLARMAAGVGAIGVLVVQIAQVVSSMFTSKGYDLDTANKYGWIITVIVLTVISTLLFELAGLGTRERVKSSEERRSMKENFKIMWTCKPFRQILISGILRSPIQLLMLVAMSFITYYYANGDFMNLFKDGINWMMLLNIAIIAIGVFAGQFIAMAVTPILSKKFENKSIYNAYSIGGAVPFFLLIVAYFLADGNLTTIGWVIVAGVLLFFASFAMGGINVMQSVMIADCVDYEEYHTGIRPDGIFFSGQSFITKLSGGIAALIQSAAYAAVGFSDKNIAVMNEALANGESFVTYNDGKYAMIMFFLISVPIAVGMILSAIPTLKYALSDKEHERILGELIKKRSEAEGELPSSSEEA